VVVGLTVAAGLADSGSWTAFTVLKESLVIVFKVLGPLEIHTERRVLRPRRGLQSALLTVLLAEGGRLLPTDSLVEELWGEQPPAHVENALQAHVSRLRHKLDSLDPGYGGRRLVSTSAGYEFDVRDTELDAAQFAQRLEQIRNAADLPSPTAVARLRATLSLFRGPALGGQVRGALSKAAASRFEEQQIYALELLFDNELRCGNHASIIAELYELVARHPFKERFWQQLMLALYRSERQAEALRAYRSLWDRLTEELGLQPSPMMARFETAILHHDPALDLGPALPRLGAAALPGR
jgi:SARP family transcriptional regulator, regulator of embCAB operon